MSCGANKLGKTLGKLAAHAVNKYKKSKKKYTPNKMIKTYIVKK